MVGPAPPAEPPLLPPPMLGIPPMPAMPENNDGSKCRHKTNKFAVNFYCNDSSFYFIESLTIRKENLIKKLIAGSLWALNFKKNQFHQSQRLKSKRSKIHRQVHRFSKDFSILGLAYGLLSKNPKFLFANNKHLAKS
jgi:hypothetical protein